MTALIMLYSTTVKISDAYFSAYKEAFEEAGLTVSALNTDDVDFAEKIFAFKQRGYEFVFSFNGLGECCRHLEIPQINLCDNSLTLPVENALNIYFDRDLGRLASSYGKSRSFGFSPAPALKPAYYIRKFEEREIDILFSGKLSAPDKIKSAWASSRNILHNICYLTAELLEDRDYSIYEAVNEALSDCSYLEVLGFSQLQFVHQQLGAYMTDYYNYKTLEAILDLGFKATYSGPKSYCSLFKHKNLTHDISAVPENAKLYLTTHPQIGYGTTTELLSAASIGAIIITEPNEFLCDNFGDLFIYTGDSLFDRISEALSIPGKFNERSFSVSDIILKQHQPANRVRQILDLYCIKAENDKRSSFDFQS